MTSAEQTEAIRQSMQDDVLETLIHAVEIIRDVEKDTNYSVDSWTTPEAERFTSKAQAIIDRARGDKSAKHDVIRDLSEALHDLLTRPTDGAARERARAALSKAGAL